MTRLVPLLLLAVPLALPAAGPELEVVTLRHRPAESVLPALQPLAAPDASVSGSADKLFLRGPPARVAELKRVIAELDRAPRRLQITVRQDIDAAAFGRERALAGRYRSGEGAAASLRSLHTHTGATEHGEQRLQVLDGEAAYIASGSAIPLADRTVTYAPGHALVHDSIRYRDVTRGFYVVPRVHGERVTLAIHPHHERLAPGNGGEIAIGAAATTVSARLGEWVEIGAVDEDHRSADETLAAHTRRGERALRALWVRVDELP